MKTFKDLSAMHLDAPDQFAARLHFATDASISLAEIEQAKDQSRAQEAWQKCQQLAQRSYILEYFGHVVEKRGLAGERRNAMFLFLAVISRLLLPPCRPVSVAVKGPSAGGKSNLVESVLIFFPRSAYYALSGMSERALAYSTEPLKHRMLVIYEAPGMASEFATYLIRSLLSEGCIRYETVMKTADGLEARLIEREGPTGLITTTTAASLHPENETRLASINVVDTPDQTRSVMQALADEAREVSDDELDEWHALQIFLESGERNVAIPYAGVLARAIPPLAVRLRRDFGMLLNLIRAHALLHQASRGRDEREWIIATPEDYRVVRELVADLIASGLEATVPERIRETVAAVDKMSWDTEKPVTVTQVAARLGLDKSAVSRRVREAVERGYLRNLEDKRGRPAKLELGDPLPEEQQVLPTVEELMAMMASPSIIAPRAASASETVALHDECCAVEGVPAGAISLPLSELPSTQTNIKELISSEVYASTGSQAREGVAQEKFVFEVGDPFYEDPFGDE